MGIAQKTVAGNGRRFFDGKNTDRVGYWQKSITTAASITNSNTLKPKTTAKVQYLTPTRVPPAGKIGVWGKKIAEARRNCLAPMRQAAAKFFANLSAEKRGDLQKYFDAFSPPPHAYRRKI